MSDYGSFLIICFTILIFNFLFNRFDLIKDKKDTSFHKKFIEKKFEPPFSGGIFIIFTIIIYLNISVIFKFFLLTIFLIGFLSDLNLFKSINLRVKSNFGESLFLKDIEIIFLLIATLKR